MKHLLIICAVALSISALAMAQDAAKPEAAPAPAPAPAAEAKPAAPADAPAAAPASAKQPEAQPSAEQVLNELLKRRAENPLIEPTRPDAAAPATPAPAPGTPAASAIGTAPGATTAAPLRREGQFIITRRARMVRAPGGGPGWLMVFEADSSGMQDPPMYVLPCQLLEDMEAILQQQGDSAVFIISGQVYVYRGANYIMPTLMKIAPQRDNLQP